MLKIISFKICPFVQRVTALLEAKKLNYKVEYISLNDKPGWFLDISPNGQVPVLIVENGTALFESDAIVEYLEEVYPPLQSDVPAETRALNRAWSYLASKNYLVQCGAQRSPDLETLKERSARLAAAFSRIEPHLGDGPFFGGTDIGQVDIAWLPLLHRAEVIRKHSGYDFTAAHPRLQRWQKSLLATGLAERSVASDFEQAFTGFYLSEETSLGRGCDPTTDAAAAQRQSGGCC